MEKTCGTVFAVAAGLWKGLSASLRQAIGGNNSSHFIGLSRGLRERIRQSDQCFPLALRRAPSDGN